MLRASFAGRVYIKPGTIYKEMFASLDWVPTLVEIAGGPKANDLKNQIEEGPYPGIVKTTLDGVEPDRLSHRQVGAVGP